MSYKKECGKCSKSYTIKTLKKYGGVCGRCNKSNISESKIINFFETKEVEIKEVEIKEVEIKEVEIKEVEINEVEIKEVEIKEVESNEGNKLYINNYEREAIIPPSIFTDEQKVCYKKLYPCIQNTKYEHGKILDDIFPSVITDLILRNIDFFIRSKQKPIALKGGAGSGKTTVITYLIKNAITEYDNLCVLAPTHKALKNIKKSFKSVIYSNICSNKYNLNIKYSTISKFLNAKIQYDENGKSFYEISPDIKVPFSHIIIDEMSMINKGDFEALENIMKYKPKYIIYIFRR